MLHGYIIIFLSQNLSTVLVNEFLNFSVVVQEERGEEGGEGGAKSGQEEEDREQDQSLNDTGSMMHIAHYKLNNEHLKVTNALYKLQITKLAPRSYHFPMQKA